MVMKINLLVLIVVFISTISFSQEDISTATGFTTAAEGNLYKATDDGLIYIGLRGGNLQLIGDINSKLLNGKILIGNASDIAKAVTPNGDVTISNIGVTIKGQKKFYLQ